MREETECCGECRWHRYDNKTNGWICNNPDSDYYADWTDYNDRCEEWEGRS